MRLVYFPLSLFILISKKRILKKIKARETQRVHDSEQWKKKQQHKTTPNLF